MTLAMPKDQAAVTDCRSACAVGSGLRETQINSLVPSETGMNDHVGKPIQLTALIAGMQRVLEAHEAEHEAAA